MGGPKSSIFESETAVYEHEWTKIFNDMFKDETPLHEQRRAERYDIDDGLQKLERIKMERDAQAKTESEKMNRLKQEFLTDMFIKQQISKLNRNNANLKMKMEYSGKDHEN